MRRSLAAIFIMLVSVPALATDDLSCEGDKYLLYMSVGSDNIVDSATLSDKSRNTNSSFRLAGEIENTQLIWANSENDFSANRLKIILRRKDGATFTVEAKGRKGALHHQQKSYTLDCNWER